MLITDYPTYHIFRNGSILSEHSKKFLKPGGEYKHVTLLKNGKEKSFYIHRLLAMHFIPNPNNYDCVDHIDGNRLNNSISNLRWCTKAMNNRYDNHKLRCNNKSGYRGISYDKTRNKWRVNKTGIFGKRFNTLEEAIEYLQNNI